MRSHRVKIEVYGHDECPFCLRAKSLLESKGWNYIYYNIKECPGSARELSDKMKALGITSGITVPQVFINGESIGGYTDLEEYAHTVDYGRGF